MNWAWDQSLAPGPKLVLMALADASDDGGICWPRVATIAKKCSLSKRTVQRVLREFEVEGLLWVQAKYAADGSQRANTYRLNFRGDKLSPHENPDLPRDAGVAGPASGARRGPPDKPTSSLKPPTNQNIEPPPQNDREQDLELRQALNQVPQQDRAYVIALTRGIPVSDAQQLLTELSGALADKTIRTTVPRWFAALVRRYKAGTFAPTLRREASLSFGRSAANERGLRQGASEQSPGNRDEVAKKHLDGLGSLLGISR
jgi:hypothetical protein